VTGWCLELHDLAASKLAAGRKKDLAYVQALFKQGLIRATILKERLATLPVTPSSLQQIKKIVRAILSKRKPSVRSRRLVGPRIEGGECQL
jgi:hypothetical protein